MHSSTLKKFFFSLWWDLLGFTLSTTFYITCSNDNYIYHMVHCIPSAYFSYNWKFIPFNHLHPIPPPQPSSDNLESDLFFYEFVCFFLKYIWPTTILVPVTQQRFDISIDSKIITRIIVVTMLPYRDTA